MTSVLTLAGRREEKPVGRWVYEQPFSYVTLVSPASEEVPGSYSGDVGAECFSLALRLLDETPSCELSAWLPRPAKSVILSDLSIWAEMSQVSLQAYRWPIEYWAAGRFENAVLLVKLSGPVNSTDDEAPWSRWYLISTPQLRQDWKLDSPGQGQPPFLHHRWALSRFRRCWDGILVVITKD